MLPPPHTHALAVRTIPAGLIHPALRHANTRMHTQVANPNEGFRRQLQAFEHALIMQGKVQARYSPEAPYYAVNYNANQTQVRLHRRLRVCAPT